MQRRTACFFHYYSTLLNHCEKKVFQNEKTSIYTGGGALFILQTCRQLFLT